MIRRTIVIAWAVVGLLASGAPADASVDGPAPNTGTVVDGLTDVYAMEVARGHVYLTPGPDGSSVAVMNTDGSQAARLDDVPGASGEVAVKGILYVAASGGSEIARFDLSTDPATPMSPLSTSPLSSPRDLRYAGGHLWFTTWCGTSDSRVGWMPLDGAWVNELTDRHRAWDSCTGLDGNAYAPNRIFLHDEHVGPTHLFEYAVGKPAPTLVASDPWRSGNYHGQPVTPMPGGKSFAMPWRDGNPSTFSMQDMRGPLASYHGIGGTVAVTDRNGGFVAATRSASSTVKQVKVWHLASADPAVAFTLRDDYPVPLGPLAFSHDGRALYVVAASPPDQTVVFRVFDPTLLPSTLYVETADASIDAGDVAELVVHLDTAGTNRDVTLMAAPWVDLGPPVGWQAIGMQTVDAGGTSTFDVSPTRNTYYAAVYAGDAVAADAVSVPSPTIFVTATVTGDMQGAFSVVNGVAHYHDADPVSYAMHVEPSDIQLFFHVHVEVNNNGVWMPAAGTDVTADGSGDGTATFAPNVLGPAHYRVSASSYGSVLVANGQSRWTRFVVEP